MGEGIGAIVGEMGTGKRRACSNSTVSAREGGSGEEHDSAQGQEEGEPHAQDAGARTVFIMQLTRSWRVKRLLDRPGKSPRRIVYCAERRVIFECARTRGNRNLSRFLEAALNRIKNIISDRHTIID